MNTYLFFKRLLLVWIFAFSASLWGQTTETYTFNSLSWGTTTTNWTSGKSGLAFLSGRGIQITTGTTGAFGNSPISFINISEVKVNYSTNASNGVGTIRTFAVSGTASTAQSGTDIDVAKSVTTSGGTTNRTLTFTPVSAVTGYLQIYVTCTTNSIYIHSVDITYGGSSNSPTVSTITATDITGNSATFSGNVTAIGGSAISGNGTVYSIKSSNPNPLLLGTGVTNLVTSTPSSGTGTFINPSGSLLSPNVQYAYKAYATNSTDTAYGLVADFYTLANIPSAVTLSNPQLTTLNVALNTDGNPASTQYAIQETNGTKYIQANGSLGASAVWQTSAAWSTKTVTGLTPSTSYTFVAKARNGANVETASGQSSTESTLSPLGAPTATTATVISQTNFTANWNSVPSAISYLLDIYTETAAVPTAIITETFSNIPFDPNNDANNNGYKTRNWTGDGGINWTAYEARTDRSINLPNGVNKAITLNSSLGAKLESGNISNGVTNISFDVMQAFTGTGGILTIKVLSGPTFSTITNVGIHAYTTTASTFNSPAIGGITGNYKIVIENNDQVKAIIDNLSFTSPAVASTLTYVPGYENLDVGNVITKVVTGLNPATNYKYRVRAVSGTAISANSNVIDVTTLATSPITWNGTSWSNSGGVGPNAGGTDDVVINGVFTGPAFKAKKLTVNAPLTINTSVTAETVINNNSITVADNASFIQTLGGTYNDNNGTGTFTVNRGSISLADKYAFWSSPVENQDMFNIIPAITKVMTYNTTNNLYNTLSGPALAAKGVGYSIKTPSPSPSASFIGKPNNGGFTTALTLAGNNFNLVGNPYPSAMDLYQLYTLNGGNIAPTVWLWDNTSNTVTTQSGTATSNLGYATANIAGPTVTWVPADNTVTGFTGNAIGASGNNLKIGQGFIVKALTNGLAFDNSVRVADVNANNFTNNSSSSQDEGKYWLNLKSSYNYNTMQAITYQTNASNAFDAYDSKSLGSGSNAFYSFAGTEKLIIQGRSTFNDSDIVALGNKLFDSGNYTIELFKKEGLFENGQAIILRDKLLGTETNLQNQNYTFASNAGEFSNRFEIVYVQSVLGTETASTKESLNVYRDGENFIIESPSKIKAVEVYDASGKLVQSLKSNLNIETIRNLPTGVYMLNITTAKENVSKKVIK